MVKYIEKSLSHICTQSCKAGDLLELGDDEDCNKSENRKKKSAEVLVQGVTPKNRHVLSVAQQFLNVHWDQKKPLLLSYSGGVDSKALLYALLDCQIVPHIAHVDHGWRKESETEAKLIEQEAKALGCPFFSTRLSLHSKSEEEARDARLQFLKTLCKEYAAVLLAHQADDLAETVLKRVFEGAHLAKLFSMEPISYYHEMTLWRPFLYTPRKELEYFLEEKGLMPFIDPTNSDPHYLRARMRKEIIPYLCELFGKEIGKNLVLLSQRSLNLKQHLEEKIARAPIHKGPWGLIIESAGLDSVELSYLIQKFSKQILSRQMIETLVLWLKDKEKSKFLSVHQEKFWADEGRLWIFSKSLTN